MYKRSVEDKRRLKRLQFDGYRFAGAYEHPHGYLKRYSYSDKTYKKLCGRAVRRKLRQSDFLYQGNNYRKISEYQWKCW